MKKVINIKAYIKYGILVILCSAVMLLDIQTIAAEELSPEIITNGIFGDALDACRGAVKTKKPLPSYKTAPLTVEFWVKINKGGGNNMLIANEPRESATHWAIYTDKDGTLCAFFPGMEPSIIKPKKEQKARKLSPFWQYAAMTWDGESVALFRNGKELVRQQLISKKATGDVIEGPLTIGHVLTKSGSVDCNGHIDEVRISKGVRDIVQVEIVPNFWQVLQPFAQRLETLSEEDKKNQKMASRPFSSDKDTLGLWHFNRGAKFDNFLTDESKNANHLTFSPSIGPSKSELDKESYNAGPSPLESKAETISLKSGSVDIPTVSSVYSLDGEWEMVQTENLENNLIGPWTDAMPAPVPGSVHTALHKNGIIPDPYFGKNQEIAKKWSNKTYYYRKEFSRPPKGQDQTLVFEGICNRCTIWLNGKKLGEHEGMFDSIKYSIRGLLKEKNNLVVKLEPAIPWRFTVVFNNSYGWHYAKFPPLGIWKSVFIRSEPAVQIKAPFIATRDIEKGTMDLVMDISGPAKGCSGKILGAIEPENFQGKSFHFEKKVSATSGKKNVHIRFNIPDPKLWWPVDMGKPNLYRLKLALITDDKRQADAHEIVFGIRTLEKKPVAGIRHSNIFDWTFVINGKPMFVKGTGWCTADVMMDFSRERYERFISLAADQHVQMLRGWGSGMVETDDFYDLCNRYGIMVIQEWPTAWNSHHEISNPYNPRERKGAQPYNMLERTVREGIMRLRNHPSLVLYGAGNESRDPYGRAIDMMGRLAIELDGTRDFHRCEAGGGSQHDYGFYWRREHIDNMYQVEAIFWGEFGVASYPNYESVIRYLPKEEQNLWPITMKMDTSFNYHTPKFNEDRFRDWKSLSHVASYYTESKTMQDHIWGTQVAQAASVCATLERARTRWPYCTGALYYKMNDNCPAASWATVDWYGAPKIAHYFYQDSFAPLLGVVLFNHETTYGLPLTVPVYLLDDSDALKDKLWELQVRAYGSDLKPIKQMKWKGNGSIENVKALGEFSLDANQTKTNPLFMVIDVLVDGKLAQRNYNFTNCEKVKDCLLNLPKTRVLMSVKDGEVVLINTGKLPAFGVNVRRPGHQDTFTAKDNYIWLEPNEEKVIKVNSIDGLKLEGWNL